MREVDNQLSTISDEEETDGVLETPDGLFSIPTGSLIYPN